MENHKKKNILIVGATGQIGNKVIELLSTKNHLQLFGTSRNKEKVIDHANVTGVYLDLEDKESIRPALKGMDSALLMTSYTADMMRQSKRFLDIAKEEGVKHIVHIGASSTKTNEVSHWGWHQFIEAYIEKLGFDYTHLQPESFMQNIFNFGWLQENTLHDYIGNSNWTWIDTDDIAEVIAQIFIYPEKYHNETIPLGYDAKTIKEISEIMTEVTEQNFNVVKHHPDEFRDMTYQGTKDSVYADAYMKCVSDQFALNASGEIPSGKTFDNFEYITGRKPTTWKEFIQKNKHRIGTKAVLV
ncbi:NmrA family NAD(P)-binding protein [uncultured Aquimarina sp.]|uniref:NmrA family NAD(P)-binding protein n=1 Tax=uncultured Aquimarina sp. TaxID=575652 RepID=UPI00262321D8|nr:NmrA family NAD(P)-binding protein [uncultured Aquimarina sp.]